MGKGSQPLLLWLMLLALAASNILLLRQNLRLRAQLGKPEIKSLRVGDKVEPLTAAGLDGQPVSVSYDGGGPKRVLLFFGPDCPYSHAQFAYWCELLARTDRGQFEITLVTGQGENSARVKNYLRSAGCLGAAGLNAQVALLPENLLGVYKLSSTPTTQVFTNDGRLEKIWVGKWNTREAAEAAKFFGVHFSSTEEQPLVTIDKANGACASTPQTQ